MPAHLHLPSFRSLKIFLPLFSHYNKTNLLEKMSRLLQFSKLRSTNLRVAKPSEKIFFSIKLLLLIPFNLASPQLFQSAFVREIIIQFPRVFISVSTIRLRRHFARRQLNSISFDVNHRSLLYLCTNKKEELGGIQNSKARYTLYFLTFLLTYILTYLRVLTYSMVQSPS